MREQRDVKMPEKMPDSVNKVQVFLLIRPRPYSYRDALCACRSCEASVVGVAVWCAAVDEGFHLGCHISPVRGRRRDDQLRGQQIFHDGMHIVFYHAAAGDRTGLAAAAITDNGLMQMV